PPGDARSFALELRERELLARHGKGWAGPVRHLARRWRFHRGYVEGVTLPATEFLRRADELCRVVPLRAARLTAVTAGRLQDLANAPVLGRLRALDLSFQPITVTDLEPLLQSPRLAQVRSLNLRGTAVCNKPGLLRLSRCEHLRGLRALDVSQHW